MQHITIKNKRKIYEQNYQHGLRLRGKLKSCNYKNLKYKLHYNAQLQLEFSIPKCICKVIDEEELKLSDYKKLNQKDTSSFGSAFSTINDQKDTLSFDSAFSSSKDFNSSNSNNSEEFTVENNNNKDTITEDADFNTIINAFSEEMKRSEEIKRIKEINEIKSDSQSDGTPKLRRTNRYRPPVLYQEKLSHIQFIGSTKYSNNLNIKHSLSASSKNSPVSEKRRKISPSTPNQQLSDPQYNSTPKTSRSPTIPVKKIDDSNCKNCVLINNPSDYIKIHPLGKNAKASILDLRIGSAPADGHCRYEINFNQMQHVRENEQTNAAVASITNEDASIKIPNIVPKKKVTRKQSKRSSLFKKSDLAKYIETFEDDHEATNSNLTNHNNNESQLQQQQQILYQSSQNAGVSTTTRTDLDNVIISSNGIHFNEILLENDNFENIINYIEGDNSMLISNLEGEINSNEPPTAVNILQITSPQHISSTTDLSNQQNINTTPYDIIYQSMLPPIVPATVPQPVVKNYYERAIIQKNSQQLVVNSNNEYHLINVMEPFPAHESSRIYNQNFDNENALDLSKDHHTLVDIAACDNKATLITSRICNNSEQPTTLSALQIDGNLNNTQITKGADMPLLDEDYNSSLNSQNKINSNSSIETNKNDNQITIIDEVNIKPKNQTKTITDLDESCERNKNLNSNFNIEHIVKYNNNIDESTTKENLEKYENNNSPSEIVTDKSVENVKKTTNKSKTENTKSNDEFFMSDDILKDNNELDYEQDDDCDYIDINVSPMNFSDMEEEAEELIKPDIDQDITNKDATGHILDTISKNSHKKKNLEKTSNPIAITDHNCTNDNERSLKVFKIPKILCTTKEDIDSKQILIRTSVLELDKEITEKHVALRCSPNNPTNIIKPPVQKSHTRVHLPSTSSNILPVISTTITTTTETFNNSFHNNALELHKELPEKPVVCRYWPNNPTNITKPQVQYSHTRVSSSSTSSTITTANETVNNSLNMYKIHKHLYLFGSPCFGYLKDNCNNKSCNYKHSLPDEEFVYGNLKDYSEEFIDVVYNTCGKYFKLFRNYFGVFFKIYGQKNNRKMLCQIVLDSQKFKDCTIFLQVFMNKLVELGWNKKESVQFIFDNWKENSDISKNLIVQMIIDADPSALTPILEYYAKYPNYQFEQESVEKLNDCNKNLQNYDLRQILINLSNIANQNNR